MSDLEKTGLKASVDGFAHEHIVVCLLMKKYQNVSLVDLPLSPYDIIIVLKNRNEKETIIRAQVKTSKKSISFTGGTRGGVDRTYKSDVKVYRQSTSDIIIGITPKGESEDSFDLYFVPTILIENLKQNSIAITKIECLKNNYYILENCRNKNIIVTYAKENGLLAKKINSDYFKHGINYTFIFLLKNRIYIRLISGHFPFHFLLMTHISHITNQ